MTMSKTATNTHTHLAKDGFYYPDFQSKVNANIKFNKNHLDKIGLGESFQKQKQRREAPKNNKKRKTPQTPPTGELRRSNRMRKVTPEFDLLPETFVEPRKKKHGTPGSRSSAQRKLELHELEALKNLPDWLEGFEAFLVSVPHGAGNKVVSRDNCRSVMRQTRLLVAGLGIEYHHWDEGVVWKKGVKIDLSMDFDTLFEDAVAFEAEHGRDLGNGWLMRHAIRKLQCYQQYLAERRMENEEKEEQEEKDEEKKEEDTAASKSK